MRSAKELMFLNCGVAEDFWESLGQKGDKKTNHFKGNHFWKSLGGLMLRLKFQYFGHLMGRTNCLEMTLMLGKIEGRRRKEWWRTRWLNGITHSVDMNLSKLQEMKNYREAWHAAIHGVAKIRKWQGDWNDPSKHCWLQNFQNKKPSSKRPD